MDLDIDYINFSQKGLVESFESKNMETSDLDAAVEAVEGKYRRRRKELVVLKRQRKLIGDDIAEVEMQGSLQSAYCASMLSRVRLRKSTKRERSHKLHTQADFGIQLIPILMSCS